MSTENSKGTEAIAWLLGAEAQRKAPDEEEGSGPPGLGMCQWTGILPT
jgi:hypothetical protein